MNDAKKEIIERMICRVNFLKFSPLVTGYKATEILGPMLAVQWLEYFRSVLLRHLRHVTQDDKAELGSSVEKWFDTATKSCRTDRAIDHYDQGHDFNVLWGKKHSLYTVVGGETYEENYTYLDPDLAEEYRVKVKQYKPLGLTGADVMQTPEEYLLKKEEREKRERIDERVARIERETENVDAKMEKEQMEAKRIGRMLRQAQTNLRNANAPHSVTLIFDAVSADANLDNAEEMLKISQHLLKKVGQDKKDFIRDLVHEVNAQTVTVTA